MTQKDRDRLVVLKKAQKKLITQRQAAEELGVTERHVRRMLGKLKESGDGSVLHGLRGRTSHRKVSLELREQAVRILSQEVYRGFGPTLASEYLAKKHKIKIGREALRQLMMGAGLWRGKRQKIEAIHAWRQRRSSRGEIAAVGHQRAPLAGRPRSQAVPDPHDRRRHQRVDRPLRRARLYRTEHAAAGELLGAPGTPGGVLHRQSQYLSHRTQGPARSSGEVLDTAELPPTQIGRALAELGIAWIAAHSPQAKGRVERSFGTAQDRLVKGLRVAGARTLAQANAYLEQEFVPWWNQHLVVLPANPADAHRPLGPEHDLARTLCQVHTRQVANDYTRRFQGIRYQIRGGVRSGLRGAVVRLEQRLDGSVAVAYQGRYLEVEECPPPQPPVSQPPPRQPRVTQNSQNSTWKRLHDQMKDIPIWQAAKARG